MLLTYRNCQCIVLIDNWNDAHVQQLRESVLCIDILRTLDIVMLAVYGHGQASKRTSAMSFLVRSI